MIFPCQLSFAPITYDLPVICRSRCLGVRLVRRNCYACDMWVELSEPKKKSWKIWIFGPVIWTLIWPGIWPAIWNLFSRIWNTSQILRVSPANGKYQLLMRFLNAHRIDITAFRILGKMPENISDCFHQIHIRFLFRFHASDWVFSRWCARPRKAPTHMSQT